VFYGQGVNAPQGTLMGRYTLSVGTKFAGHSVFQCGGMYLFFSRGGWEVSNTLGGKSIFMYGISKLKSSDDPSKVGAWEVLQSEAQGFSTGPAIHVMCEHTPPTPGVSAVGRCHPSGAAVANNPQQQGIVRQVAQQQHQQKQQQQAAAQQRLQQQQRYAQIKAQLQQEQMRSQLQQEQLRTQQLLRQQLLQQQQKTAGESTDLLRGASGT
jgi:hypothetical protein